MNIFRGLLGTSGRRLPSRTSFFVVAALRLSTSHSQYAGRSNTNLKLENNCFEMPDDTYINNPSGNKFHYWRTMPQDLLSNSPATLEDVMKNGGLIVGAYTFPRFLFQSLHEIYDSYSIHIRCLNFHIRTKQIFHIDNCLVDRILEPQTIAHFLQAAMWGKLPGNQTSAFTIMPEEVVQFATKPYSEWAPSPYNNLLGFAVESVMKRIGSEEDSSRLVLVEKSIQAMKSRLWEGIVPLSETRWRQKRLDEDENFDEACQHLSAAVSTFGYLNQPDVQHNLRETFNLIFAEFKTFEEALNASRSKEGKEPVVVAARWEEFIRASFHIMVTRAHNYVVGHVERLRASLIAQLRAHVPPSYDAYSIEEWVLTNKLRDLLELELIADYTIFMPMTGYTGHTPPEEGPSHEIVKRKAYWGPEVKRRSRKPYFNMFFDTIVRQHPDLGGEPDYQLPVRKGIADPEDIIETHMMQINALKEIQQEMRKDCTAPQALEQWILDLKANVEAPEDPVDSWGFVIYRLTYSQTDEEWEEFVRKLQADVGDWGTEVVGADNVKDKATIVWKDGKELGIAEGDIDAAKKSVYCNLKAITC
jgi:hypothetical protein